MLILKKKKLIKFHKLHREINTYCLMKRVCILLINMLERAFKNHDELIFS